MLLVYSCYVCTHTILQVRVVPTSLRLNQTYSFYYNNAARLLFTGVIPFCLLMAFNYGIYKAVKRRRSAFGPGGNGRWSMACSYCTLIYLYKQFCSVKLNLVVSHIISIEVLGTYVRTHMIQLLYMSLQQTGFVLSLQK